MKTIALFLISGLCALAQAPATQAPAATKAPAKAATKAGTAARKPAAPRPNPALLNPALAKAKAPELYKVKFTTTKGDIVVEVHRDWAPLGADRFYNLVKIGFFDGEAFFRTIPGFVTQWGLHPNPAVNKAWMNATLKDDPVKQSNKRGMIVFATAGPNTRSTQFFINYGNNAALDRQGFAPFGTVIEGMDLTEKFFSGYGGDPDQDKITFQGKAYLDKAMPNLDKIATAKVIFPEPVAAPAKAAAKAAPKAAPKAPAAPAQK
jgi:peptidyl-prolyl cis-trans isomerase A (cyclophilin A)